LSISRRYKPPHGSRYGLPGGCTSPDAEIPTA
jgi:hypothetical protein